MTPKVPQGLKKLHLFLYYHQQSFRQIHCYKVFHNNPTLLALCCKYLIYEFIYANVIPVCVYLPSNHFPQTPKVAFRMQQLKLLLLKEST